MNKNKGIIGIGLILVIVLGIVVVGGGAFFLGKNGSKQETNNPISNPEINQNENLPVVNNQPSNTTANNQNNLTIVNSKTYGYSIGYKGIDPKKVGIISDGKDILLFPDQSNIDTLSIIDSADPTHVIPSDLLSKGTVIFGTNQYKKYKDGITIRHTYYLISGLKDNKSIFISIENDSDNPNYLDLSSLKINTINSSEESSTEVFNHQPGEIKSIKSDGTNKWILAVDLLSYNPNWGPGTDIGGGFFINQNTKIRNLNISSSTKIQNCTTQYSGYGSGFKNDLSSFVAYADNAIKNGSGEFKYTAYFDINGTNITAIYEQCLP